MVHEYKASSTVETQVPAVLPARLQPPIFGCALIPRARVHRALPTHDAGGAALTVVAAPAGSGKTAALTEWTHAVRASGTRVSWLTVLAEDNDVATFATDLCAALCIDGDMEPIPGPAAATAQEAADAVMAVVARRPDPIVLVLDDVQQLRSPESLEMLDLLARFHAGRLRLVMAGRYEPAMGLSRLRLEGALVALTADDLAFTPAEAEQIFAQHLLALDGPDLAALMTRTGGWAAGLRMAAIALVGSDDVSARIAEFSGDTRTVADYLADEILGALPDAMRLFMIATAQADFFTVDYAEAVGATPDAGLMLDDLAQRNCMVVRHEGPDPRFSYHPLLRSYLLAELNRQPERVRCEIHGRLAEWFARAGEPVAALEHAVEAGPADDALSDAFAAQGIRAVLDGGSAALLALLATVPPLRVFAAGRRTRTGCRRDRRW
ncbi:AAA family ATPase [Speluncibacter jeojiensis]|uniref:AAA family ATPase n=1 Tax=Speluncibacter jeojiensis TaxID=2710754 RepID=A0A9X4RF26_9ACTN|nr:AAA family ATPase [Rhodococcus sp. D2-41]MDG3016399.1 AAA family ATPase [Corynebacteriales bacterium D3-21]